jgi:hypothetical protein
MGEDKVYQETVSPGGFVSRRMGFMAAVLLGTVRTAAQDKPTEFVLHVTHVRTEDFDDKPTENDCKTAPCTLFITTVEASSEKIDSISNADSGCCSQTRYEPELSESRDGRTASRRHRPPLSIGHLLKYRTDGKEHRFYLMSANGISQ